MYLSVRCLLCYVTLPHVYHNTLSEQEASLAHVDNQFLSCVLLSLLVCTSHILVLCCPVEHFYITSSLYITVYSCPSFSIPQIIILCYRMILKFNYSAVSLDTRIRKERCSFAGSSLYVCVHVQSQHYICTFTNFLWCVVYINTPMHFQFYLQVCLHNCCQQLHVYLQ